MREHGTVHVIHNRMDVRRVMMAYVKSYLCVHMYVVQCVYVFTI